MHKLRGVSSAVLATRLKKHQLLNKHIMIFKVHLQFTQKLLALPETGMGYQIIDAKRYGKQTTNRFIVYNAELIIDLDSDFQENKRKILNEGYANLFSRLSFLYLENPILVNRSVVSNARIQSESILATIKGRHSGRTGAISNTPIYANGTDKYVRLSAYEDDKRIDFARKRLKEGTFTTTEADYLDCKRFNDDPIDRYALPNDETIKWAFFIIPKSSDQYRPGIVQPANNHDGGGIEALFDHGTSNDTYLKRNPY